VKIGKLIAAMQRRDSIVEVVDICNVDVGDVDDSKTVTITAPPRTEVVAWPDRKPAN
jgi:hypothetical protein